MTDIIELLKTEKITAPSKQWRNKWEATAVVQDRNTGKIFMPGESMWGIFIWPSKDIAEEKAIEWIAEHVHDRRFFRHLGAFPE